MWAGSLLLCRSSMQTGQLARELFITQYSAVLEQRSRDLLVTQRWGAETGRQIPQVLQCWYFSRPPALHSRYSTVTAAPGRCCHKCGSFCVYRVQRSAGHNSYFSLNFSTADTANIVGLQAIRTGTQVSNF